jgi:Kinesin motor domain
MTCDRRARRGHIWIPNLSMVKVHSVADVEGLIEKGDKGRSTFATDMNDHSSRSHLILSLYVRTDNSVTGDKTASKLHLIDLAGSERVSRSHAMGERLQEAQAINKSLSALGDVIQSLKAHSPHVPYRNCKLTRLLSDSLGGKSKTLLVVNLSPTRDSAAESRCSCDFASRAKKVELGQAVRQVEAPQGVPKGPARPASLGASARSSRRGSMTTPELRSVARGEARSRT